MANSIHVNSACNRIHNLIQSSGLHFVINQTPWSSFITIRRKLIDSAREPVTDHFADTKPENHDQLATIEENNRKLEKENEALVESLATIEEKFRVAKLRNKALEEALVTNEEEFRMAELRRKDTLDNLHDTIDNLEDNLKQLEIELKEKTTEIKAVEKQKAKQDEIIQNINKGFNEKVRELKDKVKALEDYRTKKIKEEKETAKKERKARKKLRQKMLKAENKLANKDVSEVESNENNNEEYADVDNNGFDKAIEEETPNTAEAEPNLPDNTVDCTICAEPINKYEPEFFNGVEVNAACSSCKSSSVNNLIQFEELSKGRATDLHPFANDDGPRRKEEGIENARRKIRSKVKAKLAIRFENGEISRHEVTDLEEVLVKELEEEIVNDFKEELVKRAELN